MKTKFFILFILLLTVTFSSNAQDPFPSVDQVAQALDEVRPHEERPCASIHNVQQVCDEEGNVTITFYIGNNSAYTVNSFAIFDDNGQVIASGFGLNLPPQTVYAFPITVTVPDDIGQFCFTIKLYNDKVGECCNRRFCINVEECPCSEVEDMTLECIEETGAHELCFTVNHPPYATNPVTTVTVLASDTPGLCINGNPGGVIVPASINPGESAEICVTVTNCDGSPITGGSSLEFDIRLEDFNDHDYCCHILDQSVEAEGCCDDFNVLFGSDPADCGQSNGTVTIGVTAENLPITVAGFGPPQTFTSSPAVISGLAAGTYTFTVTNADGCETTETVVVSQLPCFCEDINDGFGGGVGEITNDYIADGDGFLCFDFFTKNEPDRIQIWVDGVLVVDSGLYSTNFSQEEAEEIYPDCPDVVGGDGENFTGSIPVSTGQVITITITGSDCSGFNTTIWEFEVTCSDEPCEFGGGNTPFPPLEKAISDSPAQSYRLSGETNETGFSVFPNPAKEFINVRLEEAADIRILDAGGRAIQNHNNLQEGTNRFEIGSLPKGMYLIEMVNPEGERTIEKFLKAE